MSSRRPSRPTSPRPATGFTLVELLAAIVVLGFVIVMLGEGLRFGVRADRLVAAERMADLPAIEQALRHILEQADPGVYPEPASLRGTAHEVSCVTDLPRGAAGPSRRAEVALAATGGRLVLRWRPHRHVEWFAGPPPWTETTLADDVEQLDLAYFEPGAGGWAPSWSREHLPRFVRLTLSFSARSGQRWPPIIVPTLREPLEE